MIEHDVAPSQPLSIPRSKRWIPPSRYYGDRYARTLEEAFGPYSRWEPEPPTAWQHASGYVLAALIAVLVCAISVMVQSLTGFVIGLCLGCFLGVCIMALADYMSDLDEDEIGVDLGDGSDE